MKGFYIKLLVDTLLLKPLDIIYSTRNKVELIIFLSRVINRVESYY